mgnify:CR=1 FL=1
MNPCLDLFLFYFMNTKNGKDIYHNWDPYSYEHVRMETSNLVGHDWLCMEVKLARMN